MRLLRVALALIAAATCGVAFSGCLALESIAPSQANPGSPVHFELSLCATDSDEPPQHPGCDFDTNGGDAQGGDVQLLLAVQVPGGTQGPQAISATAPEPGKELSFERSPTYESELTKLLPPGGGRVWLGWISNPYDYSPGANGVPARRTQLALDLTLPAGPGGAPFPGPFDYRWVVGGRRIAEDFPASRPVDCGEIVYSFENAVTGCVDHPEPSVVEGPPDSLPIRDFGLTAAAATPVDPGATAAVPFELTTTGSVGGGPAAALSASTTLPGVTPVADPSAVPLATGLRRAVNVPLAVPPGADPGQYEVTVTATLPTGERRSATASLIVNDTRKPVARNVRVRPKRFKPSAPALITAAGARVTYTLSEPARMRFTVQRCRGKRCRRKLRGGFTHSGVAGANSLRFSGFLRNRSLRRGRYRLVARPTDAAGNRGRVVRAKFSIRP